MDALAMSSNFPTGALVISLDFELYWGVRDSKSLAQYRANILGVRDAVPAMLELFRRYGIHATWATVGFLFSGTREDLLAASPAVRPGYRNRRLCPYEHARDIGAGEHDDGCHYAPSLIATIRQHPFQEIGSHTFSHYYCLAQGQDRVAFEADLQASIAAAGRAGIVARSIVFPRNQVNEEYLDSCARFGFRAYRGSPLNWMYQPGASTLKRLLRFADSYMVLSGDNSLRPERRSVPANVAASRFLRPYSKRLAALDGVRLWRIRRDLTSASRNGRIYHLWWHPHNFGVNLRENMAFLEGVLRHFDTLRNSRGMETLTMGECAARLTPTEEVPDAISLLSIHA
jgi:peptidoglycan/xylan/chitin deacetylase (PgdA/CDA1 family)